MQVARLEIFGFKSFMERLVLPLEQGTTGVVGPNGCGKSNIVDAIRWVLGETKASQLRGGILEDVIFNGTDKLRPLGLAEVSITLRTSCVDILEELSQQEFVPVELLNSMEIFAGSEIPSSDSTKTDGSPQSELQEPPKLTVINGGQDADVNEENNAENVSSSSEIQQSVSNPKEIFLRRFGWLKGVQEVQVTRRYYRSGESEYFINRVACRLKDMKDLFRTCGLGARTYTIVAQGEIGRIISAKPEERRLVVEESAGIMGFRERMNEAARRLAETKINLERILDVEKELTRQVNSLKRQAQRAIARKDLKIELESLEKSVFQIQLSQFDTHIAKLIEEARTAEQNETELESKLISAKQQEEQIRGELLQVEVSSKEFRIQYDQLRDDLNRLIQMRLEQTAKAQEAKVSHSARISELERLNERIGQLNERYKVAESELLSLEVQDKELAAKMQNDDGGEEELRSTSIALQSKRDDLRSKENEIREVREKLSSIEGSLATIQDQLISASPLKQLSKNFNSEISQRILPGVKALIDDISVDSKYTKALQAVLGERAGFFVADNPHSVAKEFLSNFASSSDAAKKGSGLGLFRSGPVVNSEVMTRIDGSVPLQDLIQVTSYSGRAVQIILKDIFYVETFAQAIDCLEKAEQNNIDISCLTFVTQNGELVTRDSFYVIYHEGGLLQLRQKHQNLNERKLECNSKLHMLSQEKEELIKFVKEWEDKHTNLLKTIQQRQASQRELGKQQGSVRGRMYAGKNLVSQIKGDIERAISLQKESERRIIELAEQVKNFQETLVEFDSQKEDSIKEEINQLKLKVDEFEITQKEKYSVLQSKAKIAGSYREELDGLRSKKSQKELEVEKSKLQKDSLISRVIKEYGEEVYTHWTDTQANVQECEDEKVEAAINRITEIRSRIIREGEVDSTSVQRYEEENARLEPLKIQREDLEKATAALEKSVLELRHTSTQRFNETFTRVNNSFSVLAPRLFGGGRAELELTDPQNPLDSGLNLLVRPPGKKPKSIDMLSGGEKALCATALIFSLFLERPSPLCVLDEVDAPLDEANLLRFLDLIKEMSKRTQFIMITHNKQSMTVPENLVGVTMQQPGVSRTISVSLEDAIKQAA